MRFGAATASRGGRSRPDDLVLFVNDRLVQSCKALASELTFVDRIDTVKVTVIRDQDLVDVKLAAPVEP